MATKKVQPKPDPLHNRKRARGTLSVEQVEAALRASAGIQALAADKLRVHRSTICRFVHANPQLQRAIEEITAELVDLAEAKVIEGIGKGEFPFVKYFLDHKGEAAGYGNVRRVNLTGKVDVTTRDPRLTKLSAEKLEELEAILAEAALESDDPAEA